MRYLIMFASSFVLYFLATWEICSIFKLRKTTSRIAGISSIANFLITYLIAETRDFWLIIPNTLGNILATELVIIWERRKLKKEEAE